ncbi:unnamed protein product [Cuscuta epithymum]|uniref:Reverse transcriptase domain-containing protein n=1 Tax=Cuscuta epithymum TaxID=186058 RepID=A0AAV0DEM6_9ASTE|nr:unnamed protein product [Cuscuta epithymum]CAH9138066.1 unnamed protein product [Cuscuta epithymum]
MNCLIWNLRGLEGAASRLFSLIQHWHIHLLVVIEPIVTTNKADQFMRQFGFNKVLFSEVNKIWIYWDESVLNISQIEWHSQFTHFKVASNTFSGFFTAIYGNHSYIQRRVLWQKLVDFSTQINEAWLVGGDFNAIASHSEHLGQSLPYMVSMTDFANCISSCDLVDLPFSGTKFTWTGVRSNGRLWRRLDRVLFNSKSIEAFDHIQITHLNKTPSDHSPILLQMSNKGWNGPKPFKFLNMWTTHPSFISIVDKCWKAHNFGRGMYGLVRKLKCLKHDLKKWNREVFGNIFEDIKTCEQEVLNAEIQFEEHPTESNRTDWSHKRALLMTKYRLERKFWKQKAHLSWLKEGDSNTHFFHSFVKVRNRKQQITSIKNDEGVSVNTLSEIGEAAVHFFSNLYSYEQEQNPEEILQYIPNLLERADNDALIALPGTDEIKEAVWGLNPNGAAGPDGYNGKFFKKCWHIVGDDVVSAVQEFFIGVPIPKGMSSSLIVLIPKKDNPESFTDYRPICLSNFVNKVCTKVLANRLAILLPKLISDEQAGFLKGKDIADQILIGQEMIHAIDKKVRGSNLVIKLDMAKAFDRLSWNFLSKILQKFGFAMHFIQLVLNNLQATFFSVLINGSPQGFFKPLRGVKQGDPLSPFLFILASEAFSRGLKWQVSNGLIQPYWLGRFGFPVTHLAYADDLLIFINGGSRSIRNFKKFLSLYENTSGQAVNFDKSAFVCGNHTDSRSQNIKDLLGMQKTSLPIKYLGAMLHKGINRHQYCRNIINKFDSKLSTWKQKHLSQGGRLILIKHVLGSIPLHLLSVDCLPQRIRNILNKKLANFFWGTSKNKPKYHWRTWKKLCYPKEEGGLDIRSLKDIERAFSLKLWWKWKDHSGFWSKFIHSKYPRGDDLRAKITDSPVWKRLCSINDTAAPLVEISPHHITWKQTKHGQFSFNSAYNSIRHSLGSAFSYKHIWNPKQQLKIQLFQWKLFKGILPISDKLVRFQMVIQPSVCPICRGNGDTTKHVFLNCTYSRAIWNYFSQIMNIRIQGQSIRHLFFSWWFEAGSKSMIDMFKHNLPGIISWHLWKLYCDLIWGSLSVAPPIDNLIWQIKLYTQNWVISLNKQKFSSVHKVLLVENLIPKDYRLTQRTLKPVRWLKPKSGFKLNVDAAYIPGKAFGGAILRNDLGRMIYATSFPLEASSSLEAELKVLIQATKMAIQDGFYNFQVESDAEGIIDYVSGKKHGRWTNDLVEFRQICFRKGIHFRHVFREGNGPAHLLASLSSAHLAVWSDINLLPNSIKVAIHYDLFNIPSFRRIL